MRTHFELIIPPCSFTTTRIEQLQSELKLDRGLSHLGINRLMIGGMWAGNKLIHSIGYEPLKSMVEDIIHNKNLSDRTIICTKYLSVIDGIAMYETTCKEDETYIDQYWRTKFPGYSNRCPLFRHAFLKDDANERFVEKDILQIKDLQHPLTCQGIILIDETEQLKLIDSIFHNIFWPPQNRESLTALIAKHKSPSPGDHRLTRTDDFFIVTLDITTDHPHP